MPEPVSEISTRSFGKGAVSSQAGFSGLEAVLGSMVQVSGQG